MNPQDEYQNNQGTITGETRYEVFLKHGIDAYNTAHYGWHAQNVDNTTDRFFNLVNSNPVKFLVATVTYPLVDGISKIFELSNIGTVPDAPPEIIPDKENPSHLHFDWIDANIPFLPKDEIDRMGIPYSLEISSSISSGSTISFDNLEGQAVWTLPGEYTWTVPDGVSSISILSIGGGGGGGNSISGSEYSGGGGGGGLAYYNNIKVTSNTVVSVFVGNAGIGGESTGSNGGDSKVFYNGNFYAIARGGNGGGLTGGMGGKFSRIHSNGGGVGGKGGDGSNLIAGGGGGCGGYFAGGGTGGGDVEISTNGNGGGGGGGFEGGGGGTGIFGYASNGSGGARSFGGIGGSNGGNGENNFGRGGSFGGGGSGTINAAKGSDGASGVVRIVYPGKTRLFPLNNVGNF